MLKKIFEQSQIEESKHNDLVYYNYNNVAYYFTINIALSEFSQIKTFHDLTTNESYKLFKTQFDALEKAGISNVIEKNSSLILLVQVEDMNELDRLQHNILMIEEDEYFFKKYVILHSNDAIKHLNFENIHSKVNDIESFNSFSQSGYLKELEEYIFILQLFIKLPFLKLEFDTENFETLGQKISKSLEVKNEEVYESIINFESLSTLDFMSKDAEREIENILELLKND